MKKYHPIFRIKPFNNQNKAIIKCVGQIDEGEKISDEIVELSKPIHPEHEVVGKYVIPIKSIGKYDMSGVIYKCNISGEHIVISRKYPLLCLNIKYDRTIVSGSLFQIFISLEMAKEEKRKIKKNSEYVNLEFSGLWNRHLECDEEFSENYEKYLIEILEEEALKKYFQTNQNNNEEEVFEYVNNYVNSERKFYDDFMSKCGIVINYTSLEKMRDYLVELCMSDNFYKLLQISMKCREKKRLKDRNIDEDDNYVIPTKITKMDDIKNKLLEDDEIIF